jgi:hypothetical protein
LREGFWPWADTSKEPAELTHDYQSERELDTDELDFLRDTCVAEQLAGRYSEAFGPDLLPGMVSQPVFAVPKPRSDKLRLVNHHSFGPHALNNLIPKDDRSIRLDNLHDFGKALRHFHSRHNRGPAWVFKSDVKNAFRLLPLHRHWQIRQIITLMEGKTKLRMVDCCACFGSGGSPHIWCSFFGCIIWIAIVVKGITDIFHYMDDAFGFDDNLDLALYAPYNSISKSSPGARELGTARCNPGPPRSSFPVRQGTYEYPGTSRVHQKLLGGCN